MKRAVFGTQRSESQFPKNWIKWVVVSELCTLNPEQDQCGNKEPRPCVG